MIGKNWIRKYISSEDEAAISSKVAEIEKMTQAEIIPMIVKESCILGHLPLMISTIILLVLVTCEWIWAAYLTDADFLFLALVAITYPLSLLLARIPAVRRILTPNNDESASVIRRAQSEFYKAGIASAKLQGGVLVYVSVLERQAVILADHKAFHALGQTKIDHAVKELGKLLRVGQFSKGFAQCLEFLGTELAKDFPQRGAVANEFSNHLRILD